MDLPELEFALLTDGVPLDKLYLLDVDRAFAKLFPHGSVVPGAVKLLSDDVLATSPTSPKNLKTGFDADVAWWERDRDAVPRRWREWADATLTARRSPAGRTPVLQGERPGTRSGLMASRSDLGGTEWALSPFPVAAVGAPEQPTANGVRTRARRPTVRSDRERQRPSRTVARRWDAHVTVPG
ncbi:hypothetical protein [Streptomyces sp. NPDC014995]|uniref:hypothetical protein n=1 Tax=Streptomyces sp. NPDC014995 TaxID=3364936 RepID=UPI0037027F11